MGILYHANTDLVVRHFIQVLPVCVAVIVIKNRSGWTSSVGVPLFLVWLAGIFTLWNSWRRMPETHSDFIFPTEEAILSGIVALSAGFGIFFATRVVSDLRLGNRLVLFGTALFLQLIVLVLGALVAL